MRWLQARYAAEKKGEGEGQLLTSRRGRPARGRGEGRHTEPSGRPTTTALLDNSRRAALVSTSERGEGGGRGGGGRGRRAHGAAAAATGAGAASAAPATVMELMAAPSGQDASTSCGGRRREAAAFAVR